MWPVVLHLVELGSRSVLVGLLVTIPLQEKSAALMEVSYTYVMSYDVHI